MTEPEELKLIEIVTAEVGSPRNDGTGGSALYLVPFRVNRPVTSAEAVLLQRVWDQPPAFTTMHRPGILRVAGDRLVLDGTTVDEVERYHAKTLRLVVDEVNKMAAEQRTRDGAAARLVAADEARHRANVDDVARRIDLG